MRHIMVLNSKGGCGKSTIATNLASYYASQDKKVALVDYDPQVSGLDWLARRSAKRPEICGLEGHKDGMAHLPRNSDIVIVDAPARSHGPELTKLVKHAETIIVPVLPSSIDMQAAAKFLNELSKVGKVERKEVKIAVVANRVRESTLIYEQLDEYLESLRVPYIAALREAQNYIRAYTRGLGIFELPEYLAWPDWEQWDPIIEWLDSRRSRPARKS
jgi:chromosome partitioning protein